MEYIPYGEVFVEERNSQFSTNFLFNAKELDNETGLYYYGARYLDPTGAMWLSVDPLFEKYAGMSPYNYCMGNPVKLVDPDGRDYVRNDNGEIVYFEKDLSDRLKIGEHFQYKGGAGVYLGKTYDDVQTNTYYSLFGQSYKLNSKEGKCVKALDKGIMTHVNEQLYYYYNLRGYETEDNPSISFDPDFVDKNKSIINDEEKHQFGYAGLTDIGVFVNFSNKEKLRGEIRSLNLPGEPPVSPTPIEGMSRSKEEVWLGKSRSNAFYFSVWNKQGSMIAQFKFGNTEKANKFLNKIYNLFPKYGEICGLHNVKGK